MEIMDIIKEFEWKSGSERKELVKKHLKRRNIKFKEEHFTILGFHGTNIIAEFGKGKREIIISAHHDRVPLSPGANDNASGVACLIQIAEKLKAYSPKNKIKLISFDMEEGIPPFIYCIGSGRYVKKHGIKNVIGAYNLEMVGNGDSVGIWSVSDMNDPVLVNLIKIIKKEGLKYGTAYNKSIFASDHLPFNRNGFKGAYSITNFNNKEIKKIKRLLALSPFMSILFYLFRRKELPSIIRNYHNRNDSSERLDEKILKKTVNLTLKAAISLDKSTS